MTRRALLLLSSVILAGCANQSTSSSSTPTSQNTSIMSSMSSSISSSSTSETGRVYQDFMYFPKQIIEVDQKEYLFSYASEYSNLVITSSDPTIAEYNSSSKMLIGHKVGKTSLILEKGSDCQMVEVEVKSKNSLKSAWTFEQVSQDTGRKNFIVIGDSVSADETYFNKDRTYAKLVANLVGGELIKNYAIGGTTATYMYPGSNIEKEYGTSETAIDGVRVTKKAFTNNELKDVDYAFIAYGHNDQYFQPPIDSDGTFSVKNFDSAHSFKGSYRYMINLLRLANPKVRIILLNCTYSEYAVRSSQWNYKLTYEDYRHAITEIAQEMDCKLIDPWNYMKKYFDGKTTKAYYHDDVHLSVLGHQKLRDYVMKH